MSCVSSSQKRVLSDSAQSPVVMQLDDLNRLELESEPTNSLQDVGFFQRLVLERLMLIREGCIQLIDGSKVTTLGQLRAGDNAAKLIVRNPRFYKRIALKGSLGAAESYIEGDWDSPNLCELLKTLSRNTETLSKVDGLVSKLLKPLRVGYNWLRRNTRSGSRKNIAAHYDLSNDFFGLMLDPSMTYSSAVFADEGMDLAQAQREKYDRVCRKLQLKPGDQVIEIGTGWGGFAEHAVQNYGCHVTTTTISAEQHQYALERFRKAGLEDRISLLRQDYRDLKGQFDKLVSIEMIEAVGEKFLNGYFKKCCELLKPNGAMCIQAITIPDHRYDAYRRSVDFIQRYIFPGGFLPSFRAIAESLSTMTDFRLVHSEDFGPNYATTLDHWRKNFWSSIQKVESMGFDNRFIRTWEYYLCYCQAGFEERLIGVSQIVFTRPMCRLAPLV